MKTKVTAPPLADLRRALPQLDESSIRRIRALMLGRHDPLQYHRAQVHLAACNPIHPGKEVLALHAIAELVGHRGAIRGQPIGHLSGIGWVCAAGAGRIYLHVDPPQGVAEWFVERLPVALQGLLIYEEEE